MKTTIESYQNMTESQRDLKIAKLFSILEKALLLELNEKITFLRLQSTFKLFMNKIIFLYSLPIKTEVTPTTETKSDFIEQLELHLFIQKRKAFKSLIRFCKLQTFNYFHFKNKKYRSNKFQKISDSLGKKIIIKDAIFQFTTKQWKMVA